MGGNHPFYKLQASGNDFILIPHWELSVKRKRWSKFVKHLCERKWGVGADGVLVIETAKDKSADFKMRIFNSDGSEAEMCGNGIRCSALWIWWDKERKGEQERGIIKIETKAGPTYSRIVRFKPKARGRGCWGEIKVKMVEPIDLKLDLPLKGISGGRKVNYINTGVPHTVVFVDKVDNVDVEKLGRRIRFDKEFAPIGTNVDFVEVLGYNFIKLRTYERGVEKETLSCGTGSVAAAIVAHQQGIVNSPSKSRIKVKVVTKSGEILKVYFKKDNSKKIKDVWLEGKAHLIYKGYLF